MRAKLLYALMGLQIFGLVLLYGYQQSGLGYPVYMLRTAPVDPRDLLRGDYIILGYEISRLPEKYKDDELPEDYVYVQLKRDGDFWTMGEVTSWEPDDGTPFLQARREGRRLVYDLEKYFVPEGKGNPPGKMTVEIAVRPDGKAQIKQLYSDGKAWP
jgi:uncharacterized membrane-anchored protein